MMLKLAAALALLPMMSLAQQDSQEIATWGLKPAGSSILILSNCMQAGQRGTLIDEMPATDEAPGKSYYLFDGYIFVLSLDSQDGGPTHLSCSAYEVDPYSLERSR